MWIYESLGTPIASIVSSIVAQVLNKPVTIEKEIVDQSKQVVHLKILEGKKWRPLKDTYFPYSRLLRSPLLP
jgi:hypothetical protein